MEDYKKKYEEAIERLKQWDREHPSGYSIQERDEFIFPELAESEDERIRKALMQNLKERFGTKGNMGKGLDMPDVLAWLEKQGEENIVVVIPKFRVGDVIRSKGSAAEYTIESISGECYHGKGWGLPISCDNDYELVEQKPAEWNEEDESHIRYLIECLENCKKGVALMMTTSTAQEYINWLKSLRPQSHWKPSDEQMEAVRLAAEIGTANNSWAMGILKGMYQDLKKLREK